MDFVPLHVGHVATNAGKIFEWKNLICCASHPSDYSKSDSTCEMESQSTQHDGSVCARVHSR